MSIKADVQTLDPGARVNLFVLDATAIPGGPLLRFHGHMQGDIVWRGDTYTGWPISAEGFARTSEQQPTPKLVVGNLDGSISALCLMYDDLVGALIERHVTHAQYLDAVNFPSGNPTANPDEEYPVERYFIDRKVAETAEAVEFALASVFDFRGVKLPRRPIIANQCPFKYRGPYCNYNGPPVADENDQPTSDPLLDRCGHRPESCALRLWPDGVQNYGGFAAAGLVRT